MAFASEKVLWRVLSTLLYICLPVSYWGSKLRDSRHVSPIHLRSAEREKSFRPLLAWKLIFSLVRTPQVSCKWSLMWTGATCATSIPSHRRQGRPHHVAGIRICPKAEHFRDHSSTCHGGQMQRGSSNSASQLIVGASTKVDKSGYINPVGNPRKLNECPSNKKDQDSKGKKTLFQM